MKCKHIVLHARYVVFETRAQSADVVLMQFSDWIIIKIGKFSFPTRILHPCSQVLLRLCL